MSLLHRHPARIASIREAIEENMDETFETVREQYPSLRREGDPETFDDYVAAARKRTQNGVLAELTPRIVDAQIVSNVFLRMRWAVVAAKRRRFRFLTNDRPLMTSNGLGHASSFVALPISQLSYFMADGTPGTFVAFPRAAPDDVIARINYSACLRAERFVISHDEKQTRFVDNRLERASQHDVLSDSRGASCWERP